MIRLRTHTRRGVAVLVLVVVVSLFTLVTLTIGTGGADDISRLRLREESLHAMLAVQSAAEILLSRVESGDTLTVGDVLATHSMGVGQLVEMDVSDSRYVVEGRSGRAVRRVELRLGM